MVERVITPVDSASPIRGVCIELRVRTKAIRIQTGDFGGS
jgi:hypothetical protein